MDADATGPGLDARQLRELLLDPQCPFGRDAADVLQAIRERRQPVRTRWLRITDLAAFIVERLGRPVALAELDRLMLEDIGAHHVDAVNLDEIHKRLLRRLTRRRAPLTNATYEVPADEQLRQPTP